MNFRYKRTAAAVLCALASDFAGAEQSNTSTTEVLDPIRVEADQPVPNASRILPESVAVGRESADALRDLLGVSGSRIGGHGTDVSIRGQSQTRINVLLDGAYVHGGCPNRMDPPTAYAVPGNYEEITVIRGTQTLEYGGGGAGGTILFERATGRFSADEPVRGEVDAGYRGNSDTSELGIDVAGGTAQGFARFIGSYTDADNYEDGNGDEVRAAYEERSGTLILGYTPSDATRAEFSFERQETRDLLYPGAGMDSPLSDNDTLRLKFESSALDGPWSSVKAEVYRSEVEHVMDNYTLRTPANLAMLMRAPSTSDTTGGRIVAELDSSHGHWKLGIDTQRNDRDAERINDANGMLNSVLWPGVEINQTGVFAELTRPLGNGNRVIGGLRYDYVTSDASKADIDPPTAGLLSPNDLYAIYYGGAQASEKTDHNLGGLLRLEHDLANGQGTVYAGISRSVRTPDATERYIASNGPLNDRWVGNPDIESEKHHQAELGMSLRGQAWDAEASVFYNDVSDYVLRDRFTAVGNNATIYRNVDATLMGGEAKVGYRFNANWRGELGAAYVRAHNETDDRPVAQTPPLEGLAAIEFSQDALLAGGRVRAAATQTRVDTVSSSGIAGQGLDVGETSGWAVLDLYANYKISKSVSLDAGVDNVFDKAYAQHMNRANAFDPTQVQVNEPGRTAWIKLSAYF